MNDLIQGYYIIVRRDHSEQKIFIQFETINVEKTSIICIHLGMLADNSGGIGRPIVILGSIGIGVGIVVRPQFLDFGVEDFLLLHFLLRQL